MCSTLKKKLRCYRYEIRVFLSLMEILEMSIIVVGCLWNLIKKHKVIGLAADYVCRADDIF